MSTGALSHHRPHSCHTITLIKLPTNTHTCVCQTPTLPPHTHEMRSTAPASLSHARTVPPPPPPVNSTQGAMAHVCCYVSEQAWHHARAPRLRLVCVRARVCVRVRVRVRVL